MSKTATFSNPNAQIQQGKPPVGSEMAQETALLSPNEGGSSKKGRGLLSVPSRSSSQRNESSPTSTGLSGATVSDSRNSIGSRSKDSKASFLGRQRNGSASSNRTGGDTEPTTTPGNTQPNSPLTGTQKKKKKGGLLSLFGCCGAPDTANTAEGEEENVHKLEKLPQRPATAKSRTHTPQEQPGTKSEETDPQTITAREARNNPVTLGTEDQITPADRGNRDSRQSVTPAVTVDPPSTQTESDPRGGGRSADDDVDMPDVPSHESRDTSVITSASETQVRTVPPPPPPPGPGPLVASPILAEAGPSAVEPQKWLLPPIAPEFKGKKCLVLDLDETLVHSSFKVMRPMSRSC